MSTGHVRAVSSAIQPIGRGRWHRFDNPTSIVISLASATFLVAFICDAGAIARLLSACLAGHVGQRARLATFGVLLLPREQR
jgi:hypothetical protein